MILRSVVLARWTLALAAAVPSSARAHDALQRSVPARDAHLAVAPTSLRLTFTSAPQLAFVRIRLLGPDSTVVQLGAPRLDSARTVVLDITGPLKAGVHTVVWQIAGADGHPVRGQYTFTIVPGAAGLDAHAGHAVDDTRATPAAAPHHDPTAMPGGPGFNAESPGYAAIRWANLTALVALIGAVAFRLMVLPVAARWVPVERFRAMAIHATRRTATLGAVAAGVLVLAAVARLLAQSYAMHGAAQTFDASLVSGMVAQTSWGRAWLGHLGAGLLALGAFSFARRGSSLAWTLAAVAAVGAAFTSAAAGHAAATPWAPFTIAIDAIHVIAAAGWLGGLLLLVVAGIPAAAAAAGPGERGSSVADLVNAFSPVALIFASFAALTGGLLAWSHLGSVAALWQSVYGRVLLVKLAILVGVAFTGAWNWLRIRPSLASDGRAVHRLRASASIELVITVVVIGVTAILVATPPPSDLMALNTSH